MEMGRDGGFAVRTYRWDPACVSLGRNQPTGGSLGGRPLESYRPGLDVVRRPTGGRSVFHGPELTYAFVTPERALGGPRAIYATVHAAVASALRRLGVPLDPPVADPVSPTLDLHECFIAPAPGEITVRGRKLVGSAQWRHRGAVLQHGSVLFSNLQSRASATGTGGSGAIALDELGVDVSYEAVHEAFVAELSHDLGVDAAEADVPAEIECLAEALEERYASEEWTWRR